MRWIDDTAPREGALNMAIDEVLLAGRERGGEAILRTYRWEEATRSIGYFSSIIDQTSYLATGERLVRRLTGGGVVDHGEEVDFTYSLIYPVGHPLCSLPASARYREIHGIVVLALQELGVSCMLASEAATKRASVREADDCFKKPVAWDVLAPGGSKLAGAGQRRRRDGLLHQGSVRAKVGTAFPAVLAERLSASKSGGLSSEVREEAAELALRKYATESWLRGRKGGRKNSLENLV